MNFTLRVLLLSVLFVTPIAYAFSCVLDNQFFSCRVANSLGVSNIPTPKHYIPAGWGHSSDRDGDGISCEPA
jgi:hypothetical protein